MKKYLIIPLLLLIISPAHSKPTKSVMHAHGEQHHQHILPGVGLAHRHKGNNKKIGSKADEMVEHPYIYNPYVPEPAPQKNIVKYGNIMLYSSKFDNKKTSYHFSNKTYGQVQNGDFYYGEEKFWANNIGQGGLIDLGKLRHFNPKTIKIPTRNYYKFGLQAKHRHIYISKARKGEDNRYILFRVNYFGPEKEALNLEYYILETGSIVVQSNRQANFSIRGPNRFTSRGRRRWEKENILTGEYTIIFDHISGYQIPPSQTKQLKRDGTIVFTGEYRPN